MRALSIRTAILALMVLIAGCLISLHPNPPGVAVLYAQSVPTTVRAQWSPNPAADNVTAYTVVVDGGAPIAVAPTVDPTCSCVQTSVNLTSFGAHTVTVTAVNLLLSSDPTSGQQSSAATPITFSLNKAPAAVTGAAVKK